MPIARSVSPPALFAALLAACGADTTGSGGQPTTTTTTTSVCAADSGAMTWAPGLAASASDGAVTITLVSADPAPPAKGQNSFVIDVTDAGGQPITGAAVEVKSFMPAHGHWATLVPTVEAGSQPGRYAISGVDLFMLGLWQVTFTVTPAGGAADPVMFSFCVEG